MMLGTLWLFHHGLAEHGQTYALTLAFTTFVLFQFFNVFNANFLKNGQLWLALAGVLVMQGVAVHWQAAQALFGTTDLQPDDWLKAALVASSVLLLDEARKLIRRLWK
jgi:Ca2+-transporting ATPase